MSSVTDTTRRGIINQGAFFSPYYLFDLLARQHADELDPGAFMSWGRQPA